MIYTNSVFNSFGGVSNLGSSYALGTSIVKWDDLDGFYISIFSLNII